MRLFFVAIKKNRFVLVTEENTGLINVNIHTGTGPSDEMVQFQRATIISKSMTYSLAMKIYIKLLRKIELTEDEWNNIIESQVCKVARLYQTR